jgi:hypothetical protein
MCREREREREIWDVSTFREPETLPCFMGSKSMMVTAWVTVLLPHGMRCIRE